MSVLLPAPMEPGVPRAIVARGTPGFPGLLQQSCGCGGRSCVVNSARPAGNHNTIAIEVGAAMHRSCREDATMSTGAYHVTVGAFECVAVGDGVVTYPASMLFVNAA